MIGSAEAVVSAVKCVETGVLYRAVVVSESTWSVVGGSVPILRRSQGSHLPMIIDCDGACERCDGVAGKE